MNNSTILLKIYLQDLILLKSEKSFLLLKDEKTLKPTLEIGVIVNLK